MNEHAKPKLTETDERVRENRTPTPEPPVAPEHDDRSPLDVAFPPPETSNSKQGER